MLLKKIENTILKKYHGDLEDFIVQNLIWKIYRNLGEHSTTKNWEISMLMPEKTITKKSMNFYFKGFYRLENFFPNNIIPNFPCKLEDLSWDFKIGDKFCISLAKNSQEFLQNKLGETYDFEDHYKVVFSDNELGMKLIKIPNNLYYYKKSGLSYFCFIRPSRGIESLQGSFENIY